MNDQDLERQLRLGLTHLAERVDVDLSSSRRRLEQNLGRRASRPSRAPIAAVAAGAAVTCLTIGLFHLFESSDRSAARPVRASEGGDDHSPADPGALRPRGIPVSGRTSNGDVEYVLRTTGGDVFTIRMPSAFAAPSAAIAVSDAGLTVGRETSSPRSWLTVASAREVAEAECVTYTHDTGAACVPRAVTTRGAASGSVMTHWRVGGDELTTTVTKGRWTLVLQGPRQDLATTIADGLSWTEDDGGFPQLRSVDPRVVTGPPSMTLVIGDGPAADEFLHVTVTEGCAAGLRVNPRSRLRLLDARRGSWCVRSTYDVVVATGAGTGATPREVYEQLDVRPGGT